MRSTLFADDVSASTRLSTVNYCDPSSSGMTLLAHAVWAMQSCDATPVIDVLLQAGADVAVESAFGFPMCPLERVLNLLGSPDTPNYEALRSVARRFLARLAEEGRLQQVFDGAQPHLAQGPPANVKLFEEAGCHVPAAVEEAVQATAVQAQQESDRVARRERVKTLRTALGERLDDATTLRTTLANEPDGQVRAKAAAYALGTAFAKAAPEASKRVLLEAAGDDAERLFESVSVRAASAPGTLFVLEHVQQRGQGDAAVEALQQLSGGLCDDQHAPVREALNQAGILPLPQPANWEFLRVFEDPSEEATFRTLFGGVVPPLDEPSES